MLLQDQKQNKISKINDRNLNENANTNEMLLLLRDLKQWYKNRRTNTYIYCTVIIKYVSNYIS